MKKRVLFILAALSVMVFTACSSKSTAESTTANTVTEAATTAAPEGPEGEAMPEAPALELNELTETSTITGKVDELKDFMIVITDDAGAAYAMSFEDKPEGINDIKVGDTVEIEYTGVLDEVDAFTGTILSVKKLG